MSVRLRPRVRLMLWPLVLVIAATPIRSSSAMQSPPPSFQPTGLQPNKGYFSQLPFERIDMMLGDLNFYIENLVLPGSAGMDLRFVTTYSRNRGGLPSADPTASGRWAFGLAGVPIKVTHPGPPQPNEGTVWPGLAMGDGSGIRLFPTEYPHISTTYVGPDNSEYDTSTRILKMGNGWTASYEMGNPSGVARLLEMHDPFGNSITPDWDPVNSGRMRSVLQVTGGQHRTVSFGYPNAATSYPQTMTYDGRTWTFDTTGAVFNGIIPPAGPRWTISYPSDGSVLDVPPES